MAGLCLIAGTPAVFACAEPPCKEGRSSVLPDLGQSTELYLSKEEKRLGVGRRKGRAATLLIQTRFGSNRLKSHIYILRIDMPFEEQGDLEKHPLRKEER